MSTSNKTWDAFISYSWGNKRENQRKVIEICNYLARELQIKTWIDVVEMKNGELSKKVFEGIRLSKIFICFISSDYSESKTCMNELCLAKKLGKEIIFFVTEDISGLSQDLLTINILKQVAFYLGDSIFYNRNGELLEAVGKALSQQTNKVIKIDGESSIYISCADSGLVTAQVLIDNLKPVFDVKFESNQSLDQENKLKNCDALIAIVNKDYLNDADCLQEYIDALDGDKLIIHINLESNLRIDDTNSEKIGFFNLYTDEKKLYLQGQGKSYINLVYWMENKLPRSLISEEKSIDLAIIASEKMQTKLKFLEIEKEKIFLHPSDILKPNFSLVKNSKVVLVIIDDDVNDNAKLIEELKFAKLIGTPIFVIEDTNISHLHADIKALIKGIPNENKFQGIVKLDNRYFMRQLCQNLIKAIERKKNEGDLIIELSQKNGEDEDVKILKNSIGCFFRFAYALIAILVLLMILSISFAGVSVRKINEQPLPKTSKPSTTIMTTTTATTRIINNCLRKNTKGNNFIIRSYQGNFEYIRFFKKRIFAIVEICIPDQRYVLHFGDELVIIRNDKNLSSSVPIQNKFSENITMVATDTNIIYTDRSENLYIYDFDLKLNKTHKINGAKILNAILFNKTDKTLYVVALDDGIYLLNSSFEKVNYKKLMIRDPVFIDFAIQKQNLYLADSTNPSNIWEYSFETGKIEIYSAVTGPPLVTFFSDDAGFIYFVSVYNELGYIDVDKFNNTNDWFFNNIIKSFSINFAFLDSKNNLVISSYDDIKSISKLFVYS